MGGATYVDIMCLQEVEIKKDYDFNALNLNNYCLEVKNRTFPLISFLGKIKKEFEQTW